MSPWSPLRAAASGDSPAAAAPLKVRPVKTFAALDDLDDIFNSVLGDTDQVVELPPSPAIGRPRQPCRCGLLRPPPERKVTPARHPTTVPSARRHPRRVYSAHRRDFRKNHRYHHHGLPRLRRHGHKRADYPTTGEGSIVPIADTANPDDAPLGPGQPHRVNCVERYATTTTRLYLRNNIRQMCMATTQTEEPRVATATQTELAALSQQ